jgi:glycosyltransferase involved in cell wall biosynthesis
MSNSTRIVILVPDCSGGIDRLFEKLPAIWRSEGSDFSISMFKTHGRSLLGIKVLPFKLVYYSSAVFYMIVFFPVRILKFIALCLFRKIDICHINLSTGASTFRKMLFAYICRLFGVKYIIHLHGGKYPRFFAGVSMPYRKIIKSFFEHAGCVIVLGDLWKTFVVQEIGIDTNKVTILPNAVSGPVNFTQVKKKKPAQILFLGRLFEPKGIRELVDAFTDSRLSGLSWTAVLAGDGEVASYRKRINDLGLSSRVEVSGWVDSDGVIELLSQSSIFVLPSYSENLPLSMLEAMAFGLCPIVTPVGSIEDVIEDGRNGIVIPARDSEALADALILLLTEKDTCNNLADSARTDFLNSYDINKYQDSLERIYVKLLPTTH